MINVIIILVVAAIVFFAGRYLYREKKKGRVCVGCPYAEQCSKGSGGCSCSQKSK